jgi:hypothetical protein
MSTNPGAEAHNYDFADKSKGAIRSKGNTGTLKPNEAVDVLTEITMDKVKIKRKCSLAVASLTPVDLQKAATALVILNPAEKPSALDIEWLRTQLLQHIRRARSVELIEQLHNALQTAALIR